MRTALPWARPTIDSGSRTTNTRLRVWPPCTISLTSISDLLRNEREARGQRPRASGFSIYLHFAPEYQGDGEEQFDTGSGPTPTAGDDRVDHGRDRVDAGHAVEVDVHRQPNVAPVGRDDSLGHHVGA